MSKTNGAAAAVVAGESVPVELKVEMVALQLLRPAPYNGRAESEFGDIQGLADSIRAEGLLQPITVRPVVPGAFEIVCGHRRVRALQQLGWMEVPAVVRELEEDEARIVAAVDNLHRADINPVSQALGFKALVSEFGLTVEEVGRRMGKPAWYVRQALDVLALPDKVVAAVRVGRLAWKAVAQVLRIEDQQVRAEAAARLLRAEGRDGAAATRRCATVEEARDLVFDEYLLRLDGAPFDVKDPNLVRDAGACTECPLRSGAKAQQISLFADVSKAEAQTCTKPSCWRGKAEVTFEREAAAARASGQQVWPNSGKLFGRSGRLDWDSKVADLDLPANEAPGAYTLGLDHLTKPLMALVGEHLTQDAKAVAQDPTGRVRHLAKLADVTKALLKAGIKVGRPGAGAAQGVPKTEQQKAADRRQRLKNEIERRTHELVVEQSRTAIRAGAAGLDAVQALALTLLQALPEGRRVAEAWGYKPRDRYEYSGHRAKLASLVDKAESSIGCVTLLGELALEVRANFNFAFPGRGPNELAELACAFGVDAAEIRRTVAAEATKRFKEREAARSTMAKKEKAKAKAKAAGPVRPKGKATKRVA